MQSIESAWKSLAPGVPFEYSFLDEDYDRLYRADTQLGKVSSVFSLLALFVGCLGLLGLTAFSAERRYREIGIRKALGATSRHVILLITREIFLLILFAFLVAVPVTWYLISDWLQNFTTQVSIDPLEFVLAGIAVLGTALLTVSFLSLKAAGTNPVEVLREE